MERIKHVERYYTSYESIERKFDKYARKQPLKADELGTYRDWAQRARVLIWKLLGLDKMEECDLNAKLLESVEIEGRIRREKILIQVEPEVYMPFYILYPNREEQRFVGTDDRRKPACVIAVHGHQSGGKESLAGRKEIPTIADVIERYHYDYGLKLAQKGYIAVIPDARGYGERRELASQKDDEINYLSGSYNDLSHMAEPLGMTVVGMRVYDLMRLVDYIYERDDFDLSQLGCVGFGDGGMQTLMTAALDVRLQKLIVSGSMYGFKDSLLVPDVNCSCSYVPHLWEYYDMGDIGALLAPREVIIQSCKEDPLNGPRGLANVYEQLEIMNQAYSLYQAQGSLRVDIREGGHRFHGQVLDLY